ncbi:glycoside hydrolase family 32 protein [Parapedobacter luteus]|nr:glycoside hydrolase family 32 protein [Parapedobacter luteus]
MLRRLMVAFTLGVLTTSTVVAKENLLRDTMQEKYRPQYHFSPKNGWIGDPDGLVFTKGLFHLYWWGHAVSPDLVHWQELPYPMKGGDGTFSYFSGSVVVDKHNTGGFGENSMLAFYTKHFPGDSLPETQAVSISRDGGLSYHYYENNPVLDIGKIFFRDPQVFWHTPDQRWKMVVSLPDVQEIHIYESDDLKQWRFCSAFGGLGAQNSFWECPDLFEIPVLGESGHKKWVMLIGRGPNRVQYFVGDFDGQTFTPDSLIVNYLQHGSGLQGVLYDDFEKGISAKWKASDRAFQSRSSPVAATDFLGEKYLGDLSNGLATGYVTSEPFTISHGAINFLIAGGRRVDSLSVNLIVDDQVVRSTTGDNTSVFKWNGWDVRDLAGKVGHIEVVDLVNDTSHAAIAIDHVLFSDQLMSHQLEHALWLDYGNDYYATRIWRNYDDPQRFGDTVFAIGWMGNWEYARKAPSSWGRGFQSIPRTMALKRYPTGYRIVQRPINQLKQLRQAVHRTNNVIVEGVKPLEVFQPTRNTYEMEVEFRPGSAAKFGFNLLVGDGRKLVLTYDPKLSMMCLDRTNCTDFISDQQFTKAFAKTMYAPVDLLNNTLKLHIFVDQASVEIFTNDGEVVFSAVTYPGENQTGIELFAEGGSAEIVSLTAWEMKSIWGEPQAYVDLQ